MGSRLYVAVREPLLRRRWRALPMTLGLVCLTVLVQFAQNQTVIRAIGWCRTSAASVPRTLCGSPFYAPRSPSSCPPPTCRCGRPGADPARLRPRRDLPRLVAHPHDLPTSPPSPARSTRAWASPSARRPCSDCPARTRMSSTPALGGRGGPRRVPGVALPRVCDRRCGDRRDGGGGGPQGQPRGQGASGRPRRRGRPVRGLGTTSPAYGGGAGRRGVGLAPDQVLDAAAGPAQRRS